MLNATFPSVSKRGVNFYIFKVLILCIMLSIPFRIMFRPGNMINIRNDKSEKILMNDTKSTKHLHWLQRVRENQVKRQNILQTRCSYCKHNVEDNCDHLILENKRKTKELYSGLYVDEKHKVSSDTAGKFQNNRVYCLSHNACV